MKPPNPSASKNFPRRKKRYGDKNSKGPPRCLLVFVFNCHSFFSNTEERQKIVMFCARTICRSSREKMGGRIFCTKGGERLYFASFWQTIFFSQRDVSTAHNKMSLLFHICVSAFSPKGGWAQQKTKGDYRTNRSGGTFSWGVMPYHGVYQAPRGIGIRKSGFVLECMRRSIEMPMRINVLPVSSEPSTSCQRNTNSCFGIYP